MARLQRKRKGKSFELPLNIWLWVGGGLLGVALSVWYVRQTPPLGGVPPRPASPPPVTERLRPPPDWLTYRVADPQNPRLHYAISIPPGHRGVFREFGFDVEVLNGANEVTMLVARYRGPNGELSISTGAAKIISDEPFGNGRYFVLETPPEAFNPNAPVWWNNGNRHEVHLPVPPLGWVVVFGAPASMPRETFTTFASSLRLPRQNAPPK